MMIKAIFVDFFGVFYPDSMNEWLKYRQLDTPSIQTRTHEVSIRADLGEITTEEFFSQMSDITGIEAAHIRQEFQRFEVLDQEVVELVDRLREDYTTVLISNSVSGYLREQIERHRLEAVLDHIVISAEVGAMKPKPGIYRYALNLAEVEPGSAVFIDDRPVNVEAAQELGINAVVFKDAQQMEADIRRFVSYAP